MALSKKHFILLAEELAQASEAGADLEASAGMPESILRRYIKSILTEKRLLTARDFWEKDDD